MPNTPIQDAVNFVYTALIARTPAPLPGQPHADLAALGVVKIALNEPSAPYYNFITVRYNGFREIESNGLLEVDVLVDVWSAETMTAPYAPDARFAVRVEKIAALIRQTCCDGTVLEVGDMASSPPQLRETDNKRYFYNAQITVPVVIGGGA